MSRQQRNLPDDTRDINGRVLSRGKPSDLYSLGLCCLSWEECRRRRRFGMGKLWRFCPLFPSVLLVHSDREREKKAKEAKLGREKRGEEASSSSYLIPKLNFTACSEDEKENLRRAWPQMPSLGRERKRERETGCNSPNGPRQSHVHA